MGVFDRFQRWSLEHVERPWGDRPAIFEHVRKHVDPFSRRMKPSGERLPDEELRSGDTQRWAPGALDGVLGHHVARQNEELRLKRLVKAAKALLARSTAANLRELYGLISKDSVLPVADAVSDELRGDPHVVASRVHALGTLLAREAPDREAVKFGLALIGLVETDDRELLLTLGTHEELTLFAAVALAGQDAGELALWELASRVQGWGRIQTVERLAGAQRPEVRAWLLREGFRNDVMNEYSAYTCAVAGRLHDALAPDIVDAELLNGAAGIFTALAAGGPAEDLSAYEQREPALAAWLSHLERRPLELEQLEALDALASCSAVPEGLRPRIERLRTSEAARRAILAGLSAGDRAAFARADAAASQRGLDTFPLHAARLERGADDDAAYGLFRLMQTASSATIDRALALAEARVDLAAIATGPADEPGFGEAFAPHRLLDSVLAELGRFPGTGEAFVAAGLRSPVVRNRNLALRVLGAWGREHWSPRLAAAVDRAAAEEPDAELQARFERARSGQPLDGPA